MTARHILHIVGPRQDRVVDRGDPTVGPLLSNPLADRVDDEPLSSYWALMANRPCGLSLSLVFSPFLLFSDVTRPSAGNILSNNRLTGNFWAAAKFGENKARLHQLFLDLRLVNLPSVGKVLIQILLRKAEGIHHNRTPAALATRPMNSGWLFLMSISTRGLPPTRR